MVGNFPGKNALSGLLLIALLFFASPSLRAAPDAAETASSGSHIALDTGWQIQSSAKVKEGGDRLSTDPYRPQGWFPARVPSTVLAALVSDEVYPDPYYGMNLRSIPGTDYPIGQNFSNRPMSPDSPFAVSWWFRKTFALPRAVKGRHLWLNFDAINYRANIWLNGQRIADATQAIGMYRMFEFDITKLAFQGVVNTLAIEVFPPTPTDLSLTFVDWNPLPPDKDMGLVRDVYLRTSGPVAVRNTQVLTRVDTGKDEAQLTIVTDLKNATDRSVEGTLRARVDGITLSRKVQIAPQTSTHIAFSPMDTPQLTVAHPKLWWPYPLGPQNLHQARVEFISEGSVSDRETVAFGIREITSEIDAQGHRLFKINGKPILIRGGGWTSDMLLRFSAEREENELRYVRDMHLNTIRLEGKLMNDHFFEACDRYGILVMAGWCCCSYWEQWRNWKPEDYSLAGESLRDQVRRVRNHPCVLAWLYGSDNAPNVDAETVYLKVLHDERWPNPALSSAAERKTEGAGPTGVKMTGPYDYVAPNYWLQDQARGGAFGFNTETSPGPAIPELASLREMLPKEHLWPIDEFWNFHAGGGGFREVRIFSDALAGRYGKADTLEDYVKKSQLMTYEGERAMFEAFGRNKYTATGVIQWLLNNAWPSLIWHLYDYYLRPGGGYFGTKKACEPLHVQYSYDDRSVVVVNAFYRAFSGYQVTAKVYDLEMAEKFSKTAPIDIAPDSSTRLFPIPDLTGLSGVYFVKLDLQDEAGKTVSTNFYWLSTQPDVSDWTASDWRTTPIQTYADLTGLQKLPQASIKTTSRSERRGTEQIEHVTVENPTSHLAFFIRLRVLKGRGGDEVIPALWEDNYITLLPGEKRQLTVTYQQKHLGGAKPVLQTEGWNVAASEE